MGCKRSNLAAFGTLENTAVGFTLVVLFSEALDGTEQGESRGQSAPPISDKLRLLSRSSIGEYSQGLL